MIGSHTSNRLNRFSINGQGVQEELFFNNNDLNWPLDAEAIWRWDSDTASSGLMHEQPSKGIDAILSLLALLVRDIELTYAHFKSSRCMSMDVNVGLHVCHVHVMFD
jgi:hypothetical protein